MPKTIVGPVRSEFMNKAFIQVVDPDDAEGILKRAYRRVGGKRGKIAHIHQAQSLNPKAMTKHLDFYMALMYGDSPLSRKQRELIGAIVSYYNNCQYCIVHHYEALKHTWTEAPKIEFLANGKGLSEEDSALIQFSKKLTQDPSAITKSDYLVLRDKGFSDREILDLTLIVGYFNFVNRLVLGLAVELEPQAERKYKY